MDGLDLELKPTNGAGSPVGRLSRPRSHAGPHQRPARLARSGGFPAAGREPEASAPDPGGDARLAEIAAVYQAAFGRFLRVAAAILGDVERGRDAVQDAFARAIVWRREYRGEGPIDAWLWRIVVNHACNCRRDSRAAMNAEQRAWLRPDEAAPAFEPGDGVLRELIASLPERQRTALFLRYYADLDYEQIADALGIRPGTVGATISAAHRTLRARLGANGRRLEEGVDE